MTTPLKIIKVGNGAAVILPKELRSRLRVSLGDTLYASESPDGIHLTAADPDFGAKMDLAERILREDRDILRVPANDRG